MFLVTFRQRNLAGSKSIASPRGIRAPFHPRTLPATRDPAARGAVSEAARAAGIGRDGSTDAGRSFGGVGRIELAGALRRGMKSLSNTPAPAMAPWMNSKPVNFSSEITQPPSGTPRAGDAGAGAGDGDGPAGHGPAAAQRGGQSASLAGTINRSAWPRKPEASSR